MTGKIRAAIVVLAVAMGIWAWWWNEIEYVDLNGALPHYTYFAMWNVACILVLAVLALGKGAWRDEVHRLDAELALEKQAHEQTTAISFGHLLKKNDALHDLAECRKALERERAGKP